MEWRLGAARLASADRRFAQAPSTSRAEARVRGSRQNTGTCGFRPARQLTYSAVFLSARVSRFAQQRPLCMGPMTRDGLSTVVMHLGTCRWFDFVDSVGAGNECNRRNQVDLAAVCSIMATCPARCICSPTLDGRFDSTSGVWTGVRAPATFPCVLYDNQQSYMTTCLALLH